MDNKTMSILGLVLSFLIPLAGIIISAIALNKIKQSGVEEGKGLATAGLIIGIIMMVISLVASVCLFCLSAGLAAAGAY